MGLTTEIASDFTLIIAGAFFAFAYGETVAEPSPRILVKKGEKYNVKQEGRYNYLNGELVLTQARADFKSNHHCFLFLPVADVDAMPGKRKSKLYL